MKRFILNSIEAATTVKNIPTVAGSNKWIGGAYYNGFVYGAPHFSDTILKINTLDDSVSYITTSIAVTARFAGAVTSKNGFIYFIQGDSPDIIKLDPSDDSLTYITFGSGVNKFAGAVLAPNGSIYCIPRDFGFVSKIDPLTDTVSTIGTSYAGSLKWWGGFLGENGIIYGITRNSASLLRIDPATDTVSLIPFISGSDKYLGGSLAYNGKAYFFPRNRPDICEFDPATETYSFISIAFTGTNRSAGACLAPDGRIFGVPFGLPSCLTKKENNDLSLFAFPAGGSKCWGNVLASNGSIYNIPFAGNVIYKVSGIGKVTPEMYTFPADLLDLPTSLYNKFQNRF